MRNKLTERLFDQMAGGLYPAGIEGLCQIELVDGQDVFTCSVSCRDDKLSYSEGYEYDADATIRMRPETLSYILSTPDKLDLRDPEILTQVAVMGDVDLVGFLFHLVKRPSAEITGRIAATVKRTAGYKEDIREVKRISRPSQEEVVDLMNRSIPFVITDAIDDWPFMAKTLDQIKAEFGEVSLRPDLSQGSGRNETFGDFIEKMENNTNDQVYTFGCPLPLAMWADISLPYFDWDSLTSPQIWMGRRTGEKPCTNLHRDCTHGMLANIFGRKKLVLFSPDQTEYMYPVPAFNTFQQCVVKDVENVDMSRFPLFGNARKVEVTIGAGEILVIPAFWYHCVYALDDVFSISFSVLWDSWKKITPSL